MHIIKVHTYMMIKVQRKFTGGKVEEKSTRNNKHDEDDETAKVNGTTFFSLSIITPPNYHLYHIWQKNNNMI